MLNLFKKTLAVCLIGFGIRSITCNITSVFGLVIYNWDFNSNSRNSLAFLLKIKVLTKILPTFRTKYL